MATEQFGEVTLGISSVTNFIRNLACYYAETEEQLISCLLSSSFIHADETPISIRGVTQYVWVFTNGQQVVFKLRETREATFVNELLGGFDGILISDFYSGYDSLPYKQQKCWPHLIRDINEDLHNNPFDFEYEAFVLELRNLIIPIMQTVHKYGVKKRKLNKFRKQVDRFYNSTILGARYKSELATKYQKRFLKYRDSLFSFFEQDGIPWHNNTAENAIRHLAMQRKISGSFFSSVTHDYLVLLSIRQTCRFQEKSFFKFLFSGETDLDKFEAHKRKLHA
jgi:hypothetical protein